MGKTQFSKVAALANQRSDRVVLQELAVVQIYLENVATMKGECQNSFVCQLFTAIELELCAY